MRVEFGFRVFIEWPAKIKPRVTDYPASTMDIFPTIVDILGLDRNVMLNKIDGASLKALFDKDIKKRNSLIPFRYTSNAAIIDNDFKMLMLNGKYELYDLKNDLKESKNLMQEKPEIATKMKKALDEMVASVSESEEGADYPGGITKERPTRMFWFESELYKHMFPELSKRGYDNWVNKVKKSQGNTKKNKSGKKKK